MSFALSPFDSGILMLTRPQRKEMNRTGNARKADILRRNKPAENSVDGDDKMELDN